MDAIEAKVRCLELAHKMSLHDNDPAKVAQIAQKLYNFVEPQPQAPKVPVATEAKFEKPKGK